MSEMVGVNSEAGAEAKSRAAFLKGRFDHGREIVGQSEGVCLSQMMRVVVLDDATIIDDGAGVGGADGVGEIGERDTRWCNRSLDGDHLCIKSAAIGDVDGAKFWSAAMGR